MLLQWIVVHLLYHLVAISLEVETNVERSTVTEVCVGID